MCSYYMHYGQLCLHFCQVYQEEFPGGRLRCICGHPFHCYNVSTVTLMHWLSCLQKKDAPAGEKPEPVKTHLRNMIIVPEMIGSIVGVYNGKTFNQVEIKPEMIGHYLAEFSISYKPVKHGRPGIGATHSSRFIPLKWGPNVGFCSISWIFFSM